MKSRNGGMQPSKSNLARKSRDIGFHFNQSWNTVNSPSISQSLFNKNIKISYFIANS